MDLLMAVFKLSQTEAMNSPAFISPESANSSATLEHRSIVYEWGGPLLRCGACKVTSFVQRRYWISVIPDCSPSSVRGSCIPSSPLGVASASAV